MICDRCGEVIPDGEETEHFGQTLCEDCYMQALSPSRACDPWAVRAAQSLNQMDEGYAKLSATQKSIIKALEETGGAEAEVIAERVGIKMPELSREIATLRHMEKVRGEMRDGVKVVCLW
jgi:hypothetical protein